MTKQRGGLFRGERGTMTKQRGGLLGGHNDYTKGWFVRGGRDIMD